MGPIPLGDQLDDSSQRICIFSGVIYAIIQILSTESLWLLCSSLGQGIGITSSHFVKYIVLEVLYPII